MLILSRTFGLIINLFGGKLVAVNAVSSQNNDALEEQKRRQREEAEKKETDSLSKTEDSTTKQSPEPNKASGSDSSPKQSPEPSKASGSDSSPEERSNSVNSGPTSHDPRERTGAERTTETSLERTIPGYNSSAKTPEEHQRNTELILSRLSQQIETSKDRLGVERTEYPGLSTELSSNPQIAMRQMAEQQKQEKEQAKSEAQTKALEQQETIYGLAQDLAQRGLYKEADEILGKYVLGEDPNKTISGLSTVKTINDVSPQYQITRLEQGTQVYETPEESQAQRYQAMTREEQQEHTLELMSGHLDRLDQSTSNYFQNERYISELHAFRDRQNTQSNESNRTPFAALQDRPSNRLQDTIRSRDRISNYSPELISFIQRNNGVVSNSAINEEIKNRSAMRGEFIAERAELLQTQGNIAKLAANGQADSIHLLFDKNGNALSQSSLESRIRDTSLPKETQDQYSAINNFLKRDLGFESEFKAVQETLLGLSLEEQAVRVRDFIGERLAQQKESAIALRTQEIGLNKFLNRSWNENSPNPNSDLQEIMTIDQQIISNLARENISDNMRSLYGIHDKLTEAINAGKYQDAVSVIEKASEFIDSGYYIHGDYASERELINRDISKTPEEQKATEDRVARLEQEFSKLSEEQLQRAKDLMSTAEKDLEQTLDIIRNSFNPYSENFWRVQLGETDLMFQAINDTTNLSSRLINNIGNQENRLTDAQDWFNKSGRIDDYERSLENIIQAAKDGEMSAAQQASRDMGRIREGYQRLDQSYESTEQGIKFTRNAMIIAGATLATGGSAAFLTSSGIGWGYGSAGLASFAIGTVTGTGIGFAANNAEHFSRQYHGFNDPYSRVMSQTYQDFKTSATTAAGTATGFGGAKMLTDSLKFGRLSASLMPAVPVEVKASLISSIGSSFVTTSMTHAFDSAESYARTGEVNFDAKKYAIDLLWNTSSSIAGSAIGSAFGNLQQQASGQLQKLMLTGAEEALSITSDLAVSLARATTESRAMTTEDFLQAFQSSIISRMNGHYSSKMAQHSIRTPSTDSSRNPTSQNPRNTTAENIRNQEFNIKASDDLPEGVNGRTKVTVDSEGKRIVEVEVSKAIADKAAEGDAAAQKTMIEEILGHGRKNPLDPRVKQADGTYKAMAEAKYKALRAKDELVQKLFAEEIHAKENGESVSNAEQNLKEAIQGIETKIKEENYSQALELAKAHGVDEAYTKQFEADYKHNINPNRSHLEQTSFSADKTKHNGPIKTQSRTLNANNKVTVDSSNILPPEKRRPISEGSRLLDTGIAINITDKDGNVQRIPLLLNNQTQLIEGGPTLEHNNISVKDLTDHLDSIIRMNNDNFRIEEGTEGAYRHSAHGLNHLREIHASKITDISSLIKPDGSGVQPATQFRHELNNDKLQSVIEDGLRNIQEAIISRDGSVILVANLTSSQNLAPGVDRIRMIYNPDAGGIVTMNPLGNQNPVARLAVRGDDGKPVLGTKGKVAEPSPEQLKPENHHNLMIIYTNGQEKYLHDYPGITPLPGQ
jgi:hypothetical protein